MRSELPFFMQNSDWYYSSDDEPKYFLTEKAPPEAVQSYNDFYSEDIVEDENGEECLIRR